MTQLEAFGIDKENFKWQDLAACAGMPTEWFFEEYESSAVVARNVDEACNACPVQKPCAQTGQKEEGVWGGVYWTNTGKADITRNSHKTPQQWANLEKKLGMKLR